MRNFLTNIVLLSLGQNLHWLLIYLLPSVIVITVILLIIVLLLKYRRWPTVASASNKNVPSKTGLNDCEMQWNNLSVSCASIISNSILCKSNHNNGDSTTKQCNLYKNICPEAKRIDKNVNCVDKWMYIDENRRRSSSSSSNGDEFNFKKDVYDMEATV